jgi:3-hydroxybutyryl-CoA dehydratase
VRQAADGGGSDRCKPRTIYIAQTLNVRAPVKIGGTVTVVVTVAALTLEKFRARLTCVGKVGRQVVLDGEALVKLPREEKGGRPMARF